VTFQVAGGTAPALVSGFGVVFADVDQAGAAKIEVFDKSGTKLGTFVAPVRSDATGHSFVGVKFASALIARVRITSGTGTLGAQTQDVSNGGTADLVVMDDFLYSEPIPQ
jgi:sugar lactone lactonase YvrE